MKALEDLIDELEAKSMRYWSIDPSEHECFALELDIKRLCKRISAELNRLMEQKFRCEDCQITFIELRKTITLDGFESKRTTPDKKRIETISDKVNDLRSRLRATFKTL